MITIALDTATDRSSVAASDGRVVAERQIDGARRHAVSVLGLLDQVLSEIGANAQQIERVITADGPGSFTGLRVAASVAKALTWRRATTWYTAPSLLLRAVAHCPGEGATVLALSDALRGEVFAGCWRMRPGAPFELVDGPVRARRPEDLVRFGPVDRVVGTVPAAVAGQIEAVTQRPLIGGAAALPSARTLLTLPDYSQAIILVADPVNWEPDYGRPAEAQAVWERKHGRPLPDTPVIAR